MGKEITVILYSAMPQPEESKEAKRANMTDRELNTPGIGQKKQQRTGSGSGPGSRVQCTKAHLYYKHTHTHTPSKVSQAMDGQCVQSKFELCFGFLRGRISV